MTMKINILQKNTASLVSILLLVLQLSSSFVIKSDKTAFTNGRNNIALGVLADVDDKVSDVADAGDDTSNVSVLVDVLNKRLKGGEGSLTDADTNAAITASDSLLVHLGELKNSVESTEYSQSDLHTAARKMDVDTVSKMLDAGLEMDAITTDTAFWAVVKAVDQAEAQDLPLSANVTQMLHHVFDADVKQLLSREKIGTNITCMQPDDTGGIAGSAKKMSYIFDDSAHKDLPLMEGRKCEGGTCCDACSRNIFPTFASEAESSLVTFPELSSLTFNDLEKVSASTIIQFVRLIERVRRTISHEYGLPLKNILPLQAYSRKYVAGSTQKGGGGGEGDFVILHTDEATHDGYHYSCVLYLSTQGVDFEGGDFVFNDPAEIVQEISSTDSKEDTEEDKVDEDLLGQLLRGELPDVDVEVTDDDEDEGEGEDLGDLEQQIRNDGRKLTPFHPKRGAAVIFSSGWENMHEVEKITSGVRYAVPCFFTTCPVPDIAYDQMNVGKPKTDEDIADDWLHLLLAHRKEEPIESVGRVKELLMKWHYICTPLSEH
ncbi:unnamed protein product [Pseudo-nitzschia multistriata]|uniref:Fe2OG dioxygenase domain-containing protein n=1 Tax=Pseudo-nitzschia multistriata TaxID=183589 RepID=A0A448Z6C6_9STRA|nr:unnamed protein product [Pseudo-nitzschia multistriata]